MDWSSFWSAVIGGVLVIAGHVVVHSLNRRAAAEDKQESDEKQIAALVLNVVSWFEMDKQIVFAAKGKQVENVQSGHPLHSLVALIRMARPDLNENAAELMTLSREYFDVSRILLPAASPTNKSQLADRMATASNNCMAHLNVILEAVCKPEPSKNGK